MRRTATVSLEWLLKNLTGSIDCFDYYDYGTGEFWVDFAHMIQSKMSDDWAGTLIDDMLENGIKHPICIFPSDEGGFGIGNGHHRLSIAILLALDTIDIVYSDGDPMMSHVTAPIGSECRQPSTEWRPLLRSLSF